MSLPKYTGPGINAEQLKGIPIENGTPADNDTLVYSIGTGLWTYAPGGGGGSITGATNVGTAGVGVYKSVVASVIQLKKINGGSSKISVTDDVINDEVDVDVVEANIAHGNISGIGTNSHPTIDLHLASTSNPHNTTKTQVGLGNVTDDAQLKRAAGDFATFAAKALAGSADVMLLEDAADITNKKQVQVGNLAGALAHQSLSGAGTNTHADIDNHIASTANPHSTTATQVGLGNVTNDAQLKRAAADFNSFAQKATPVDADVLLLEDSAAIVPFTKAKITWSQLPRTIIVNEEGVLVDAACDTINFVGDDITAVQTAPGKVTVTVSDASSFYPYPGSTQTVAISAVSARNAVALTAAVTYIVWASVDCHIRIGDAAVVAAGTDGHILARTAFEFTTQAGETNVAVIQSTILPPTAPGYLTIFRSMR